MIEGKTICRIVYAVFLSATASILLTTCRFGKKKTSQELLVINQ